MAYEQINPIKQFNFQINRVLTYGEAACVREEVIQQVSSVRTLPEWNQAWLSIAKKAEEEKRWLHAAYYYRMVEFFLKADDPQKIKMYQKCIKNFYMGFDYQLQLSYRRDRIPFENGVLNSIELSTADVKKTILVCGGYDSFVEEFVLQVAALAAQGYRVILFDGPGQGACVQQQMFFRYDFEKPASAVIDFYHLDQCGMIGISWGGYFALRCAAFDKRITAAVAYDVMDDGLEVMTNIFPKPIRKLLRFAYIHHWAGLINAITTRIRKKSILADWALSQGMHITGTETTFDFYETLSKHTLKTMTNPFTQDILLLAGECDHYIPIQQFHRLKKGIHSNRSVTCRLFTESEGGEQHCQIGNHMLAVDLIMDWLDSLLSNEQEAPLERSST